MDRPLVSLALLALLAGPTLGADRPGQVTGADGKAAGAPAEDESWTWFGMGFESRRQHLDQRQENFGPDSRPSGGFGGGFGGGGNGQGGGRGGR